MNIEKIYFNTEDGIELFGLLHKADNETKEIVISIHGMTSNFYKKREDILAKKMTDNRNSIFLL